MNWSLTFIFGLTLLAIFFFKKCEEFKGTRIGSGYTWRRTYGHTRFDIVDVVLIVFVIYYLFLNN